MKTVRFVIHGRVQGVGYRAWTVATASKLKLNGWVRNRTDGTVEAVFHGDESTLFAMFEACKKGPPASRVERIEQFTSDAPDNAGFISKATI